MFFKESELFKYYVHRLMTVDTKRKLTFFFNNAISDFSHLASDPNEIWRIYWLILIFKIKVNLDDALNPTSVMILPWHRPQELITGKYPKPLAAEL